MPCRAQVKLFLKRPNEAAQRMISLVLSCATNDTDNPDLRDRAYIYWRLLSTDPEVRGGLGVCACEPSGRFEHLVCGTFWDSHGCRLSMHQEKTP